MQKDNDVILIDGINVAECEHFKHNRGFNCYKQKNCNETADCYFKQLQQLKQELKIKEKESEHFMIGAGKILDKLRQENKKLQMLSCANCGEQFLNSDGEQLYDKNVQLQKENKELKNRCEEWALETVKMQGVIDGKDFKIDKLKQENEKLKKPCSVMPKVNQLAVSVDEYKKLYNALEEIREILYEQKPISHIPVSQSEFTIGELCNYDEKYIKIVGKINEVLKDV